jgi:hypothetical protein
VYINSSHNPNRVAPFISSDVTMPVRNWGFVEVNNNPITSQRLRTILNEIENCSPKKFIKTNYRFLETFSVSDESPTDLLQQKLYNIIKKFLKVSLEYSKIEFLTAETRGLLQFEFVHRKNG